MSVSVLMPQLGESVTEGTVTRWLKKEGEQVTADEPLLEVSTDKVDTEIPAPASGILRGIVVDEDETVAVGAQLAVIEDADAPAATPAPAAPAPAPAAAPARGAGRAAGAVLSAARAARPRRALVRAPVVRAARAGLPAARGGPRQRRAVRVRQLVLERAVDTRRAVLRSPGVAAPRCPGRAVLPAAGLTRPGRRSRSRTCACSRLRAVGARARADRGRGLPRAHAAADRRLAVRHAAGAQARRRALGPARVDRRLGVGGRIRKQDVIDAAAKRRAEDAAAAAAAAAPAASAPAAVPATPAAPEATPAPARPAIVPDALRGTTQRMSRPRQVIAKRMVESLQTSAQLTTVVEVDVTNIARLRDRAKAAFEAREGVKLTFLPFFAQATVEALKIHPKLNSVINAETQEVTYHAAEHLGIAVDTERGLMVPVIHGAGDLNIGGLSRKIADLAARTRSGHVGPDELAGGTFTLTNTGSRGALFDTPIINLPQVGILGVGSVVKRAVVVDDPALGEVIAVRSMVYLALTYDHRLVDGADAARFLVTVKNRLEEGAFEADLGLLVAGRPVC